MENERELVGDRAQKSLLRLIRLASDQAGVAAVEMAVLAPILIIVALCTVDVGMAVHRKMQVQNAAQSGSAYAAARGFNAVSVAEVVIKANPSTGIEASPAPRQFCGCPNGAGITEIACSVVCESGLEAGLYAQVFARGGYVPHFWPPLLKDSFVFSAQSTIRLR